jgi:GTP-binding protein
MLEQTKAAIGEADAVFFLLDARSGPMPADNMFADLVRRSGKPVVVVANKAEGKAAQAGVLEAYALGLGEPVPISAEHGEGLADLFDALRRALPAATATPTSADMAASAKPIRVAVVGRPNSGKSTLVNRLLGEDRLVTGRRPASPATPSLSICNGVATAFACTTRPGCAVRRGCRRSSRSCRWQTRSTPSVLPTWWWC